MVCMKFIGAEKAQSERTVFKWKILLDGLKILLRLLAKWTRFKVKWFLNDAKEES